MKIIEMRAIRGPNYYSRHPVIFMRLDLGELEEKPTDKIPGFKDNLAMMMPSLQQHKCSPGRVGGFYERLIRGTWAGHVLEHVALELQCLSGHEVAFGKTFNTDDYGIYNLVYRYVDEKTGMRAGEMAFHIVENLFKGIKTDVKPLIIDLKEIAETSLLGPSTQSIVNEATKKGISHLRLNEESYVQLGQGVHQRRIQATMMDNTSALGVEIADDKESTKKLLSSMGIPIPEGLSVETVEEALQAADEIGYPVVVKPLVGNHGRGITVNITNREELKLAFEIADKICETSLVEKYLEGFDYRILVIDGKFVAAALREPAYVIGNGTSSIGDLIDEINKDPDRGIGHEKSLTRIKIDYMTERLLAVRKLSVNSIPADGEKIYIKSTANISAGGTALDVTENVHPLNRLMAERISRIVGLNVIGIDLIADTLAKPFQRESSGVVEVNAAPGFRMHLNPTTGTPRNIAANVIDMLFPPGAAYAIPIVAVTGTNGKTTTTRLISHILGLNGCTVGMTSTDAVIIDNIPILQGDYSGPEGAQKVMMDSTIDHAVFEVARGGILRRGLGFKESDVGILLNISSDHLGEGGIDTLEELARLKSTVTEAVKPTGYSVFNADDALVLSCLDKGKGQPVLFSKDPEHPALKKNYDQGNLNVTVQEGTVIIQKKGWTSTVASVAEIPITFDGKAGFNVENVMAAVAATAALGLNETQVRAGLVSFSPSIGQTPGRMNVIEMGDFKVVVDYGHNIGAITATADFIKGLMPGRKIRMTSGVGNRRGDDILEFGETLSRYYDHIVLCDADPRERIPGETARIVKEGLLKGGFEPEMVTVVLDEIEATKSALEMAGKGDLVVLQADNVARVIKDVLEYKAKLAGSRS
ncbi:cyanophycin synthetase [Isachenkonia alkalipeptolytica]|uniref:Cyanophycin synthetase n=1 Tax=Isachenkonia alkalipeptolytica TaxID=2565777 RepID=A0AA44BF33_9CLOT|nr:cyanophycin synthetase [Isachenkonia alkalipeptolytica]NBG89593.1 cyanophycin synthetase [Isachenkonia alkalipeptolytica]